MSVFLVWHVKLKAVVEIFASYEDAKKYVGGKADYVIDEREVL